MHRRIGVLLSAAIDITQSLLTIIFTIDHAVTVDASQSRYRDGQNQSQGRADTHRRACFLLASVVQQLCGSSFCDSRRSSSKRYVDMTSLFMHPTSQDDRPCPNSATSPSKASTSNPFARPKSSLGETFSRATLLPTHPSPKRAGSRHDGELGLSLNTPEKRIDGRGGVSGSGSALKRQGWRHLWRGGLEIGPDGWRLDGV